jgi:hypothetical protein
MLKNVITIQRGFTCTGLLLLLMAFIGCARLPDYALPRSSTLVGDPAMLEAAFTYRQLTRADFKAPGLMSALTMHESSINAHTCTRIRPTRDSRFSVSRSRFNGSVVYIGSIEHIGFEAIMIPGCSWWNPALPAHRKAYVLQHEQIHFALVEVSARQLTVDAREKAKTFMTIHPTMAAAKAEISTTVQQWIQSATQASMATHTAFDKDTSLFYSPRWQRHWLEKVERQLADLEPALPDEEP